MVVIQNSARNLTIYKKLAVFTEELACPIKGDPLCELSNIIHTNGLISGDTYRIATYKIIKGEVKEDKLLLVVTIP
jgi:hypothetical protein